MLPSWARDEITVLRAPVTTSRGSSVRDWSNAKKHVEGGCSVQPASMSGDGTERENTTETLIVYMPVTADVRKGDRVKWNGNEYVIDGEPYAWHSPNGTIDHMVATLQDWRG